MPEMPKGMFQRGSSYYVRLFSGGQDRWVSLGSDFDEASAQLLKLRQGGMPPSRETVAQAAERWLTSYVATARNQKGQQIATRRVERYLERALGPKLVEKVSKGDLRSYRLWLERLPLSPQTVVHILSDARCLFRWCEDMGMIDRSPVPRRLLPRIQERPPDRLSEGELEGLVHLPEPHGFVIRLALATGLRWAELCRAQVAHVERGMLVVSHTKSSRVRRVPLSPELLGEIRGRVGGLVGFPAENPMSFTRTVRRLSGVERFHVHQLRHTFACRWLEAGGSLAALQQVLGHSTVVTTQRYARLDEEAIRREAERVQTVAATVAAAAVRAVGGGREELNPSA